MISSLAPLRWTRRRWIYALAVSFGVQCALLFFLGGPAPLLPPPARFPTANYLAADPWTLEQLAQLPALTDPTLLALPGPHGFSGAAWLRFQPPAQPVQAWIDPPRWLGAEAASLGELFGRFVATNRATPLLIADKPMPRRAGVDTPASPVPVRSRSELRVEGALARRPPAAWPALPSWPASDLLTNTVLQVSVDDDGYATVVTLLGASGSLEADDWARRAALGFRFGRAKGESTATGRLVFLWQTVPPLDTNSAIPRP